MDSGTARRAFLDTHAPHSIVLARRLAIVQAVLLAIIVCAVFVVFTPLDSDSYFAADRGIVLTIAGAAAAIVAALYILQSSIATRGSVVARDLLLLIDVAFAAGEIVLVAVRLLGRDHGAVEVSIELAGLALSGTGAAALCAPSARRWCAEHPH